VNRFLQVAKLRDSDVRATDSVRAAGVCFGEAVGEQYQFAAEMEDRMKKLLLAALAAAALWSGSATAADLGRRPVYGPPVYGPPMIAYFSWTGCYAGGNVGGLWANRDWDFGSNTASGVIGGLQAGCNYQVGGWVFGIQGDYDWTNANSTVAFGPFFPIVAISSKMNSLASVTGRVGYAWDRFLGYVKAGGAWEQSDDTILFKDDLLIASSETRSGWTVGIGAEYAFLNWLTGFVEYDHYGFGSDTNTFVCAGCGFAGVNGKTNVNVLKVGLNLKFFGPGSYGF
jgi:outer membrane immunogenic protein